MKEVHSQRAKYVTKTENKERNHSYQVNEMAAVYGTLLNGQSQISINRICTLAGLPYMSKKSSIDTNISLLSVL